MIFTKENYKNAKPSDTFEFICKCCGRVFHKTKRQISRNKSGKAYVFCSNECIDKWYKENCYIEVECKQCGKKYSIKKSEYNKNKVKKFFCSHSCSAKYNNHKRSGKTEFYTIKEQHNKCPICGNKKSIGAEMCFQCRQQKNGERIKEKTLGEYINGKHYLGHAVSQIRRDARNTIMKSGVEKVCAYCRNHDFDDILEVHHIKSILDFDESTKVGEINDILNLVWLCPNHHKMVEIGKIKLNGGGIKIF